MLIILKSGQGDEAPPSCLVLTSEAAANFIWHPLMSYCAVTRNHGHIHPPFSVSEWWCSFWRVYLLHKGQIALLQKDISGSKQKQFCFVTCRPYKQYPVTHKGNMWEGWHTHPKPLVPKPWTICRLVLRDYLACGLKLIYVARWPSTRLWRVFLYIIKTAHILKLAPPSWSTTLYTAIYAVSIETHWPHRQA